MNRATLALLLALSGSLAASGQEASKPGAKIGDPAGRLRFVDIRYLPRTLDDLPGKKAYVLYYTTVECPLVRRYMPRVAELEKVYRDKDVQFLAVNIGPGDSVIDMATQALEQDVPFPFVKDFSGKTARTLGIERSATVVVLDGDQRLRYRGRIDDQYRFGGVRPAPTRHDLREAIDDVLAGRDVRVPETAVDGCKLTAPTRSDPKASPTWAGDVAPIVHANCVECHRAGTEAPFSLETYEKAAANADMIGEVVVQGRMPPWFASPKFDGDWANHRGLSAAERETILAWVRAGAPAGDLSQAPVAPKFDLDRWKIGDPDKILQVARETQLPATGYVNYVYEILPYRFEADTWVSHVQISPENTKVLHHANLVYITPQGGMRQATFITGQVPGGGPMVMDEGHGFFIPKDAMLALQIHYVTTGKVERDRISVGLRFPRWTVHKQLRHVRASTQRFEIPPQSFAHRVSASKTIPTDADALALFSHMHLRGRDMRFIAHYPDGRSETLLLIPNYSFDWQLAYRWKLGAKRIPKGTRLEVVGHFDNSAFNPYNPDPSKTVRWGEQTFHEMFYGFFFYTDPDEHLNVRVDPKTGWVLPEGAPQPTPQKRFF